MMRPLRALTAALLLCCAAGPALASVGGGAATRQLSALRWFVHDSMIDVGAGRDLDYYAGLIGEAVAHGSDILEGLQGPDDTPCCVAIDTVSVQTFSGAGLDIPSSQSDWNALRGQCGAGSCGFLLEDLAHCGGPTASAIGCADTPSCDGDPDDDPLLILVVTMAAHDYGLLGDTLAHERGHNACLGHVPGEACQMMRASGGGGCLSASECTAFANARNDTGGECACQEEGGGALADGMLCSDGEAFGVCSGARCGEPETDAGLHLVASAEPGMASGGTPEDALMLSGLTGGWGAAGAVGESMAPRGLAHAPSRARLYAVAPGPGDDELLILDPADGSVQSHVGSTGVTGLVALAFDPGPSPGPDDDRLYALRYEGGDFNRLLSIDPDTASTTDLGGLSLGVPGEGLHNLAFDSRQRVLFSASPFGGGSLLTIDPTCPGLCRVSQVSQVDVPRYDAGLAYSAETGLLYLVGSQAGNRVLYNTLDPETYRVSPSIGIQAMSVGGLAAVPVPEPGGAVAAALLGLAWLRARASRS